MNLLFPCPHFFFFLSLKPFQSERLASGTSDIPDRRYRHVQNPQRWEETLAIKSKVKCWRHKIIHVPILYRVVGPTFKYIFPASIVDSVLIAGVQITWGYAKNINY